MEEDEGTGFKGNAARCVALPFYIRVYPCPAVSSRGYKIQFLQEWLH